MLSSRANSARPLDVLAVLIPAWQPEEYLAPLVATLSARGFGAIVVVDDGSGPESAAILADLVSNPGVHLVRQSVNMGKGHSLKTGFHYILSDLPHLIGVVTADADGQHRAEDIVRVSEALLVSNSVVLGSRTFAQDVPLRNRFGNELTRRIFSLLTGTNLRDTQTGLRAIPCQVLPQLITLEGDRYEYEMAVLVHVCRNLGCPLEVPIETVYIDGNRSSHFDPIRDSMQIYLVLARFCFSSIIAATFDFAGYSVPKRLRR